jgi:hypothetical protein
MADQHIPPVPRARKDTVLALVSQSAPMFLELLGECKDAATWRKLSTRLDEIRTRMKIESYVLIYEDERRIGNALTNAIMSKTAQADFEKNFTAATEEEQLEILHDFGRPGGEGEQLVEAMFPDDPYILKAQIEAFNQLGDDDKREAQQRSQLLMCFLMAWLHEALAVMVHGEKMTSLVPKALAGDEESFLKAIHIDKALIVLHPKFAERHQQAMQQAGRGDATVLEKINYRLASPVTKGRVQLAGLFSIFAMLESLGWLDDLLHREILDVCDAAGLDRWQNRIDDENAVTKALIKYRRYQKTGGLSMH